MVKKNCKTATVNKRNYPYLKIIIDLMGHFIMGQFYSKILLKVQFFKVKNKSCICVYILIIALQAL